jgi:hypothetical protein
MGFEPMTYRLRMNNACAAHRSPEAERDGGFFALPSVTRIAGASAKGHTGQRGAN